MTTTLPGWYDDGRGAVRWWDGAQWTDHVATPDQEPAAAGNQTEAGAVAGYAVAGFAPPYTAPAGHPGSAAAADAAAPAAAAGFPGVAEPPKKSRLWIVWVGAGAAMLAIVVAAAIGIPLLLVNLVSNESSGADPASNSSQQSERGDQPSTADEESAVDAVKLLDQAWSDADCDDFFAATTENYRTVSELETCEAFYSQARAFMGSVEDYSSTVRDVEAVGAAVAVSTTETYDAYFDEDGEPTEEVQTYEDRYEYFVIDVDGEWRVDDWFLD